VAWAPQTRCIQRHGSRVACIPDDRLVVQAPAVTREYQAALLQLVRSSRQEIAQRKESTLRFYGAVPGENEEQCLARLRAVEPPNAETFAAALDRQRSLWASYERIEASPALLPRSRRPRMCSVRVERPGGRSPRPFSTAIRRNSTCRSPPPSTVSPSGKLEGRAAIKGQAGGSRKASRPASVFESPIEANTLGVTEAIQCDRT
jgi:hypothetical protein